MLWVRVRARVECYGELAFWFWVLGSGLRLAVWVMGCGLWGVDCGMGYGFWAVAYGGLDCGVWVYNIDQNQRVMSEGILRLRVRLGLGLGLRVRLGLGVFEDLGLCVCVNLAFDSVNFV